MEAIATHPSVLTVYLLLPASPVYGTYQPYCMMYIQFSSFTDPVIDLYTHQHEASDSAQIGDLKPDPEQNTPDPKLTLTRTYGKYLQTHFEAETNI